MDGNPQTDGCPEYAAGLRIGLQLLTDRIATEAEVFDPSLESIVAAETSISSFDDAPQVRGYPLEALVRQASFCEVAYLLLCGELPDVERLADFQSVLAESSELPSAVSELVSALPLNVPPIEVLRTSVSMLAHFDPQPGEHDRLAATNQVLRLLARLPIAMSVRQSAWLNGLARDVDLDGDFSFSLLHLLSGREPTGEADAAFEAALILMAEQGLDASTLAARAAVSTGGDLFAALTAGMSVWSGPLHGGPRAEILSWLLHANEHDADSFIRKRHSQGHTFAGFDIRLGALGDARGAWLAPYCRQLAMETGNTEIEQTAEVVERLVAEETGAGPSLDWPLTRLMHYLGFDAELFKAVAALARIVGWAAHAIEQAERNQLLRPRGRYVGPPQRNFVPLDERG